MFSLEHTVLEMSGVHVAGTTPSAAVGCMRARVSFGCAFVRHRGAMACVRDGLCAQHARIKK